MKKTERVSKNFGEGNTKIKARFANEAQAQRVAILFQYVNIYVQGGGKIDEVREVLASDIDKCIEVLSKIQASHPAMQKMMAAPECPHGTPNCEVEYTAEYDQFKCAEHGLLYKDDAGNIVATL